MIETQELPLHVAPPLPHYPLQIKDALGTTLPLAQDLPAIDKQHLVSTREDLHQAIQLLDQREQLIREHQQPLKGASLIEKLQLHAHSLLPATPLDVEQIIHTHTLTALGRFDNDPVNDVLYEQASRADVIVNNLLSARFCTAKDMQFAQELIAQNQKNPKSILRLAQSMHSSSTNLQQQLEQKISNWQNSENAVEVFAQQVNNLYEEAVHHFQNPDNIYNTYDWLRSKMESKMGLLTRMSDAYDETTINAMKKLLQEPASQQAQEIIAKLNWFIAIEQTSQTQLNILMEEANKGVLTTETIHHAIKVLTSGHNRNDNEIVHAVIESIPFQEAINKIKEIQIKKLQEVTTSPQQPPAEI